MDRQVDRRTFLGTLVVLPVGVFLVHCGSSSGSDDPGAPPVKSGTQAIYTSSVVQDHDHTFAVDLAAFMTPPANGISGDTSNNQGHTHSVSISMADLQQVEAGQSVKVTTSSTGHTHVFTFVKVG